MKEIVRLMRFSQSTVNCAFKMGRHILYFINDNSSKFGIYRSLPFREKKNLSIKLVILKQINLF